MSIIDRQVAETCVTNEPESGTIDVGPAVVPEAHRAPRRPPASIDRLCDRIRALERGEPMIEGELRTSVLAELALVQLQAERLSLDAWRSTAHRQQSSYDIAALAERVDRLSVHWPREAEPDTFLSTDPAAAPKEDLRS